MKKIFFIQISALLFFVIFSLLPKSVFAKEERLDEKSRVAILILPSSQKLENPVWLKSLGKFSHLKLTLAFSAKELGRLEPHRDLLLRLKESKKIEPVLKLDGDPPLPLIYSMSLCKNFFSKEAVLPSCDMHWEEDIVEPVVQGKMKFKEFWKEFPKGFVPGGGSLILEIADLLQKEKFSWTVAGFPLEEWGAGVGLILDENTEQPFSIWRADPLSNLYYEKSDPGLTKAAIKKIFKELSSTNQPKTGRILVFDEQRSPLSLEDFLNELEKELSSIKNVEVVHGSALFKFYPKKRFNSLQIWPYSWDWIKGVGSLDPGLLNWVGEPEKNRAWETLCQAKEEIQKYRNSGSADLKKLESASQEFQEALSSEFFEWFGKKGELKKIYGKEIARKQIEKRLLFRATVANIYKHLSVPVPTVLEELSAKAPITNQNQESVPSSFWLKTETDNDSIRWSDLRDQTESLLKGFSVELSKNQEEELLLTLFFRKKELLEEARVHIYVDINHREGAGSVSLLNGINARVEPQEGWEYVLVLEKENGRMNSKLLVGNSFSSTDKIGLTFLDNTFLQVRIPKNLLGAYPLRWGYLVAIIKKEDNQIEDLFSPLENKEEFLKHLLETSITIEDEKPILPMLRKKL
ncbi:MAG: hypothetical protein A3I11_09225 [Elusimicrobia bacterium RIFCSPLOWO2_02_FULL_39_32]|nr:MAG: hypothetical protein A3B80_01295 [Elusimicrobia bacterium RIFCSPHIGHO2_02_FULL_39_36]OGR93452.1 MAG: hypothetical protein A3I11_09225 [Elusimicrobia bacterium RIFCSPLOWO2_02_FULL_39_32]OGS00299.1 MAG: hypothetical protein A3G85_05665 [Elusimicrobia bacterium RIFCSPLOWO2_12_FULL_39_28]